MIESTQLILRPRLLAPFFHKPTEEAGALVHWSSWYVTDRACQDPRIRLVETRPWAEPGKLRLMRRDGLAFITRM